MSTLRSFLREGHLGTLLSSLIYFDFCFAIWVLNGAMAPFIAEEFQLSPADKGLMISVPVIAGALMRFPLGLLAQYIGRKRAAQVEMSLIVIGLAFGSLLARSFAGVLIMGVILGVAGASFGVALSLGAGWYPPRFKGLAMGIAGAGNSGAVLAVLLAPPLAKAYGWQAVYGFAIVPMLVAMALLQIFAREPPGEEPRPLREYLRVLLERDAWVFNLLYAVTFGGYIGLTSFLPTLFHDQYGIPKESVGQYSAMIIIAASILRVVGGWLADRVGGVRLLKVLMAIIIACTALAATIPADAWWMVALLIMAFAAMGAGNGAVFQLLPLRFPDRTAVAGSLVGEIGALAGGALPNAMGVGFASTGSFGPGFLSMVLLAFGGLLFLLVMHRRWTWILPGGIAKPEEPAPPSNTERMSPGELLMPK